MIVGLTGSYGAGKGSVADYLVNHKGFAHFSARTFISQALAKEGLPVDRDHMIDMGNKLRALHGPSYIFEQLVHMAKEHGGDAVVESVRAVAEAEYIKAEGGLVLGVDADPKVRYERIVARGSETDHVTFEEWHAQEVKESNPDDPTKQDVFGALHASDDIINNSTTLEELYHAVDRFILQYAHK
jgi:dephospho-CoA kinase